MDWILYRMSADRAEIGRGVLAALAGVWLLLVESRAQNTPVLGFVVFLATLLVLGGTPGLRAAQ
ncbi:hypothetical protein [Actinacidiphila glaucinigra]|uniref:hypothetical protein n=1 Tax=Actinacidiphila glaucinigra TaxID=235986 RepID=UPI003720292A